MPGAALQAAITMTDRLISKRDMAAMLGTSPGVAASVFKIQQEEKSYDDDNSPSL